MTDLEILAQELRKKKDLIRKVLKQQKRESELKQKRLFIRSRYKRNVGSKNF